VYQSESYQAIRNLQAKIDSSIELGYRVRVMVFNATFINISVASWQSIFLLLAETRVPRENHQPVANN
jgi:hypothetical protein